MPKLVIVESPAKAKTISRILGSGYEVVASVGHIRDLPESASDIPAEYKKFKWAKLGVNVESDFEPLYIVPDDKKRNVAALKAAAKGCDELLLATDEDREGESISWHILEVLKPAKKTKVSRIVFQELTPEAILGALKNPRQVDENLVRAQETRRIVDRLYGYTLSPLLWKKVAPKLSAGRVQSVAVRLCVERERERMAFVSATYWDLEATFDAKGGKFGGKLTRVGKQRVATGKSFDPNTGKQIDDAIMIDAEMAAAMADRARASKPYTVSKVEAKPGTEAPPKPFTTSTLQQEAGRKLRYTSKRTMQIAQGLYEGIDLGGERVGLITYMRTDSLNLADRALSEARAVIGDLYGNEYLPNAPVRYKTNAKGAQEAHEAIRPTDLTKRPQDVRRYLTNEQFELYDLIWKRTIACQMVPAQVKRTSVEVETKTPAEILSFYSSGKEIVFPGFLRAYVEGSDDPEAELSDGEKLLPNLTVGQVVDLVNLGEKEHRTQPPARYTEASLVKKLEEEGIGRPSTYASIISTIQDRGYIQKKGTELIPTFTAFGVTQVLEAGFAELVDTEFTARMEGELDEIADGDRTSVEYLKQFYHGNKDRLGLEKQVDERGPDLPFPSVALGNDPLSGEPVVVRIGKFGPFVQRGEGGEGNRASVPDDLPPSEVNLQKAIELLMGKTLAGEAFVVDPASGRDVYLKSGRFGDYLELAQTEEESKTGEKPKRASLPPGMKAKDVTPDEALLLLRFPRELGPNSEGVPMTVIIGRYGPFVKAGEEIRNIGDWREAAEISAEDAEELLKQPKTFRRGGVARAASTPREAIKEFGVLEGAAGPVKVLDGRFGPYVTDGTTNATIPKSQKPEELTPEDAMDLIRARIAAGPSKKKPAARGKKPASTTNRNKTSKPKRSK